MRKADKQLVTLVLGGVAVLAVLQWLRSDPRCDRNCQTQIGRQQDLVLNTIVRGLFA